MGGCTSKGSVFMLEIRNKSETKLHLTMDEQIKKVKEVCTMADAIVIGAGAGLSNAAGISYVGERFNKNFKDFIDKYGMTDMYTAGFYPFKTEQEKWAYWSRHILMNRYNAPVGKPYKDLLRLVKNKDYFVITTNVDAQFYKAGFDNDKIWAVQGDYGKIQCSKGCHNTLYDNEKLIRNMSENQQNCKISDNLVPRCPVCNGNMEVNIRKDMYFVQDKVWYEAADRYEYFLGKNKKRNIIFLELGVGFNTPTIIRFPFERYTQVFNNAILVRINLSRAEIPKKIRHKSISICDDIGNIIPRLFD